MIYKYTIRTISGKPKGDVNVYESDNNGKAIANGGVGFSDKKGEVVLNIKNTSSYVTFSWFGESYIYKVGKVPSVIYFKEGIDLPEVVVKPKQNYAIWIVLLIIILLTRKSIK